MFKKNFKGQLSQTRIGSQADNDADHGMPSMSTYLIPFKVGDIVDIKANASEQKGMPHKCA